MVIGQQKGRDTNERRLRNFGMSKPEGYRKALRLMKTAEKFKIPVFTFVDTPGAYPGIDAEERCQSEAIGRNIFEMAQLEVPIITTIIGEGGSGGALAISVGDQVLMLQYSIYSVISPEGCASILWKTSDKAQDAADALGITAHRLKALGLVDKIVNEPVGGAHRDHKQMAAFLKRALNDAYRQVSDLKVKELLDRRYDRLQSYGRLHRHQGQQQIPAEPGCQPMSQSLADGFPVSRPGRFGWPTAAAPIPPPCCWPVPTNGRGR
jgi:acetyl-CoA carboxylase carboxyl transferase subunit alpha